MDRDKQAFTEADMQAEKLRKMKEQKELKSKKMKEDAFRFSAPPASPKKRRAKRPANMVKIRKDVYEKVHRAVKKINKNKRRAKLSKDRFSTMVIKRFMDMGIDFDRVKSADELSGILRKIKKAE